MLDTLQRVKECLNVHIPSRVARQCWHVHLAWVLLVWEQLDVGLLHYLQKRGGLGGQFNLGKGFHLTEGIVFMEP